MSAPARRRWLSLLRLGLLGSAIPSSGAAKPTTEQSTAAREPGATPQSPAARSAAPPHWDPVVPGTPLQFPRDHGAHPGHRTEWWYATGWLQRPNGPDAGFQITFFRTRTAHPDANPSRFAPRQLILAHAALALPERGRLLHAERAARAAFDQAGAQVGDTRVWIGQGASAWSLLRQADTGRYVAKLGTDTFALDLQLATDAPPMLQGTDGFSRKGPGVRQASHYYSRPQLSVSGQLRLEQREQPVVGHAWFDHEWSSELLAEGAQGWDWLGINLDDGGALMAYRIRGPQGAIVWRHAMVREGPSGPVRTDLAPAFEDLRHWRSPRTGARWPVSMRVQLAERQIELRPLFDDQELDARGSTGTTYWEGAVTAFERGRRIGRGYLELTGYAGAIRL